METILGFKTIADFLSYFKDEETCQKYFESIRFRDGQYCPHCGHKKVHRFADGKRFRCAGCHQDFTLKTGTIFGESKLPIRKWFIAIYLLTQNRKGISSVQMAKQVGVTQKTAWFMDQRIREAMKQNKGKLFGTVEVDETYVGGKEKNKHFSKRTPNTQGRSTQTKTPVMGFIQRGGEVRAHVIPNVQRQTIEKQIIDNVGFGAKLYTDELASYARIGTFIKHEVVQHGRGQYVRAGGIHSNSAESFWAIFKRGYHGIYHQMSKKHLQRYVDEYAFRFNSKDDDLGTVFANLVKRVGSSKQMSHKLLTKGAA